MVKVQNSFCGFCAEGKETVQNDVHDVDDTKCLLDDACDQPKPGSTEEKLEGTMVMESWKDALESGRSMDKYAVALAASQLSDVSVHLPGCVAFTDEAVEVLMGTALPDTTQKLDLNFESTKLTNDTVFAGCFLKLDRLTSLSLFLSRCALVSTDQLAHGLGVVVRLISLTLNFQFCTQIMSWEQLFSCIGNLHSLKDLDLDFKACGHIYDISSLGKSFESLKSLYTLRLNFEACLQISSIDDLANGLRNLMMLRSLDMTFSNDDEIESVSSLAESLLHLRKLEILRLGFSMCGELQGCQDLGLNIARLGSLRNLKLHFPMTTGAALPQALGACLSGLLSLASLDLDFSLCEGVLSITEIGVGLRIASTLNSLSLNFVGCDLGSDPTSHVREFGIMMGPLEQVKLFQLDLSGCANLSGTFQKRFDSAEAFLQVLC